MNKIIAALRIRLVGLLLFGPSVYRSVFSDPVSQMPVKDRRVLWGKRDIREITKLAASILSAEVDAMLSSLVEGGELYYVHGGGSLDEENVCGALYQACKLRLSEDAELAMDNKAYELSWTNSSSAIGRMLRRVERIERIFRDVSKWDPREDLPEEVFLEDSLSLHQGGYS